MTTETKIERGTRLLRRQGMADACVRLVASGFRPEVDLEQWGDVLGITILEMQAAVARYRALVSPQPAKGRLRAVPDDRPRPYACEHDGCTQAFPTAKGLGTHRRTHAPDVTCPNPWCRKVLNPVGLGPHVARCRPPETAA